MVSKRSLFVRLMGTILQGKGEFSDNDPTTIGEWLSGFLLIDFGLPDSKASSDLDLSLRWWADGLQWIILWAAGDGGRLLFKLIQVAACHALLDGWIFFANKNARKALKPGKALQPDTLPTMEVNMRGTCARKISATLNSLLAGKVLHYWIFFDLNFCLYY